MRNAFKGSSVFALRDLAFAGVVSWLSSCTGRGGVGAVVADFDVLVSVGLLCNGASLSPRFCSPVDSLARDSLVFVLGTLSLAEYVLFQPNNSTSEDEAHLQYQLLLRYPSLSFASTPSFELFFCCHQMTSFVSSTRPHHLLGQRLDRFLYWHSAVSFDSSFFVSS